VLDEGRPLVIFPEGTRSAPGERVTYQAGVAALVMGSGVPCYPVATNSGRHWGRRAFHKTPGVISISILPALPAGLTRKPLMETLEGAEPDRIGFISAKPEKTKGRSEPPLFHCR